MHHANLFSFVGTLWSRALQREVQQRWRWSSRAFRGAGPTPKKHTVSAATRNNKKEWALKRQLNAERGVQPPDKKAGVPVEAIIRTTLFSARRLALIEFSRKIDAGSRKRFPCCSWWGIHLSCIAFYCSVSPKSTQGWWPQSRRPRCTMPICPHDKREWYFAWLLKAPPAPPKKKAALHHTQILTSFGKASKMFPVRYSSTKCERFPIEGGRRTRALPFSPSRRNADSRPTSEGSLVRRFPAMLKNSSPVSLAIWQREHKNKETGLRKRVTEKNTTI